MRFNGNQPRIRQFGRVKIGDHYSVSPEATLGPTQKKRVGEDKKQKKTSRRESEQSQRNESREDESQRSEQPRSD
jgi:hypothetical protein